jgi:hypothetical protein
MRLPHKHLLTAFAVLALSPSHTFAQNFNSTLVHLSPSLLDDRPTLYSPAANDPVRSALLGSSRVAAETVFAPLATPTSDLLAPTRAALRRTRNGVSTKRGRMDGFGFVDLVVGAANGALWGLGYAAINDDTVAGEGASTGAVAGAVGVTAIWLLFGPIY